jgi:hypothetical protein
METQVQTPQKIFTQPQSLVVPLFQRPYVWNQETQWEPLWNDVVRVAERILNSPLPQGERGLCLIPVLQTCRIIDSST